MQDGAPCHTARIVKSYLQDIFGDRVLAAGWGPEWSPRSSDLTPCDFHLWGTLKNMVYGRGYETLEQLKDGIWREFENLD